MIMRLNVSVRVLQVCTVRVSFNGSTAHRPPYHGLLVRYIYILLVPPTCKRGDIFLTHTSDKQHVVLFSHFGTVEAIPFMMGLRTVH